MLVPSGWALWDGDEEWLEILDGLEDGDLDGVPMEWRLDFHCRRHPNDLLAEGLLRLYRGAHVPLNTENTEYQL